MAVPKTMLVILRKYKTNFYRSSFNSQIIRSVFQVLRQLLEILSISFLKLPLEVDSHGIWLLTSPIFLSISMHWLKNVQSRVRSSIEYSLFSATTKDELRSSEMQESMGKLLSRVFCHGCMKSGRYILTHMLRILKLEMKLT